MEFKVLKNEKNELEIEFESPDLTFPDLVANTLLENDDVSFAGVKKDHPEIGKPHLIIKTKSKKADTVLKETLDSLNLDLSKLKKLINK
jgi:DNA-directed RNA polymerase subunit L